VARVEKILAVATVLFARQGFTATTMSEIAQESETAIGSLYRFFPTKDVLADVLYDRFFEGTMARLTRIEQGAAGLTAAELARCLLDDGGQDEALRHAVASLMAGQDSGERASRRIVLRRAIRERLGAVLEVWAPGVAEDRRASVAAMVLQVFKLAPGIQETEAETGLLLTREYERLLACYLQATASG